MSRALQWALWLLMFGSQTMFLFILSKSVTFHSIKGVFIAALDPPGSAKHGNLTNGVDAAYAWMNRVFSVQDDFSGDSTHLLSEKDVMG